MAWLMAWTPTWQLKGFRTLKNSFLATYLHSIRLITLHPLPGLPTHICWILLGMLQKRFQYPQFHLGQFHPKPLPVPPVPNPFLPTTLKVGTKAAQAVAFPNQPSTVARKPPIYWLFHSWRLFGPSVRGERGERSAESAEATTTTWLTSQPQRSRI